MYLETLKNISEARKLTQADLARFGGVTRAAVAKWFHAPKQTFVNIETRTLVKLAEALGVDPGLLLIPLPDLSPLKTRFLWDHLYPNMESFLHAAIAQELAALARLVQVLGFREARKIAGNGVLSQFQKYKQFLKPSLRRQMEKTWPLYASKR